MHQREPVPLCTRQGRAATPTQTHPLHVLEEGWPVCARKQGQFVFGAVVLHTSLYRRFIDLFYFQYQHLREKRIILIVIHVYHV